MASDNSVKQAATTAKNGFVEVLKFGLNRVNPFKTSGLLTTVGLSAIMVFGGWVFVPKAMAAVATTTAPANAGALAKMTTIAGNGVKQAWEATYLLGGKVVNTAATADYPAIWNAISNVGSAAAGTVPVDPSAVVSSAAPAAAPPLVTTPTPAVAPQLPGPVVY